MRGFHLIREAPSFIFLSEEEAEASWRGVRRGLEPGPPAFQAG